MAKAIAVEKAKAVLRIGYYKLVLDYDVASQVFGLLIGAGVEVLDNKYDDVAKKGYDAVRPAGDEDIALAALSKEKYSVAKMVYAAELKSKGEA